MRSSYRMIASAVVAFAALTAACGFTPRESISQTNQPAQTSTVPASVAACASGVTGPVEITGSFSYTNPIAVETYYVEQAVALNDITGFVRRDKEWELPIDGQVLGYLEIDTQAKTGKYRLDLPAEPRGELNNVSNGASKGQGVQIFAVSYSPNLTGGPFAAGDDRSFGWPNYLASVKTDSANNDEVTGGALVVWAPDAQEQFPTGFGADGLLFTKDDPAGPLPAGYSIIDLNSQPFKIMRDSQVSLELYEPSDYAIKDFSQQSYTQAFDSMFQVVKKQYAFNDVSGKAPNWDAVYNEVAPKVKAAQDAKDAVAYYKALEEFTLAFKDGHVGLDGGDISNQVFAEQVSYGYGLALRELDDKSVVVVYVTKNSPADQSGIKTGDMVTSFNGKAIGDAISAVVPPSTQSTDFGLRYQQVRYLTRAKQGGKAEITFQSSGQPAQTVTLNAVQERESFAYTSLYAGYDPNALPVEFTILNSGAGYVRVNSNYDDLNLIIRLFNRALKTFETNQLPGIIIDLRRNSGGAPLGLAGFLTSKEITLGQLQYYSDRTGGFEPDGPAQKFYPNQEQYKFDKMVLLVNQACYSACELEAYGFSRVPGMVVMGQYPTGGTEAEVSRGQFKLPEGFSLQVPTGRFILPDGSIFLEGKGVQPTQRIPIDQASVLSGQDVVLQQAEKYVIGQ